tara:strand:+ start:637 stop:996 length:360 start_codon:yes stop_codon:yes gene_type:complete
MKALILDGKVVDVNEKEFEVHSSMSWVDCDEKVSVGWTYDGKTFKTNEVTPTAEEELDGLRAKRNTFLQASDWVVIKEREEGGSVSNFADWKKYRQELRDITKTYKSLSDVKWPSEPSE